MTTNNQTTPSKISANAKPPKNEIGYLLMKIAMISIIIILFFLIGINVYLHIRFGTPLIDGNLKSAFLTVLIALPTFLFIGQGKSGDD